MSLTNDYYCYYDDDDIRNKSLVVCPARLKRNEAENNNINKTENIITMEVNCRDYLTHTQADLFKHAQVERFKFLPSADRTERRAV